MNRTWTSMVIALLLALMSAESATALTVVEPAARPEAPLAPAVKRSRAGICHPRSTPGYEQTQRFDVFDTDDPGFVRRSRSGICYEANDGIYLQLIYFRAYRSMQDCLDSGGRKHEDSAPARN